MSVINFSALRAQIKIFENNEPTKPEEARKVANQGGHKWYIKDTEVWQENNGDPISEVGTIKVAVFTIGPDKDKYTGLVKVSSKSDAKWIVLSCPPGRIVGLGDKKEDVVQIFTKEKLNNEIKDHGGDYLLEP